MRAVASAWRTDSRVTVGVGNRTRHPKSKLLTPRRFVYLRGTTGGEQEKKSAIEDVEEEERTRERGKCCLPLRDEGLPLYREETDRVIDKWQFLKGNGETPC